MGAWISWQSQTLTWYDDGGDEKEEEEDDANADGFSRLETDRSLSCGDIAPGLRMPVFRGRLQARSCPVVNRCSPLQKHMVGKNWRHELHDRCQSLVAKWFFDGSITLVASHELKFSHRRAVSQVGFATVGHRVRVTFVSGMVPETT